MPSGRGRLGASARVVAAGAVMLAAVTAGSSAAVELVAGTGRVAHGSPRCFGAAARDPAHPCTNPALRYSVVPSPSDAQIEPSAPCTPVPPAGPPDVCAFGVAAAAAAGTVALVGDSHAVHWRAAIDTIARDRRWHAVTLSRSRCPFTLAVVHVRQPERSRCTRWGRSVLRWFRAHRAVHIVFVSQHATAGAVVPHGHDAFAGAVAGYARAWRALPRSVEHVVVIRDPPYIRYSTLRCVERALAGREQPGRACALPRSGALRPDPAMRAVERFRSSRVQGVDMTQFFCGVSLCYPVIGGALVHKDKGHLTRVYAATTAPFLQRKLHRLMASW